MEKTICPNCNAENNIKAKYCVNCGHEIPVLETPKPETEILPPPQKKKVNYTLIISILVGILILVGAGFGIRSCVNKFIKNNSSLIYDKVLDNVANEMNKNCPAMIDEYTRLDSVSALANKSLKYDYTIIGLDMSKVSTDVIDNNILNTIKNNPQLKQLRDIKTTFIYIYQNEKGEEVHKFVVTPNMYK